MRHTTCDVYVDITDGRGLYLACTPTIHGLYNIYYDLTIENYIPSYIKWLPW